jgi:CHAT domain-containing protein/tetratricopeptide (TPR) repeat protein
MPGAGSGLSIPWMRAAMRFRFAGPLTRAHAIVAAMCFSAVIGWHSVAAEKSFPPSERERVLAQIDSLHVSRQVDSTHAYLAPYLAAAQAAGDSVFLMPLTSKLGRLWASFGEPQRGEPLLREAAQMAAALGDTLRWCDALRWLGYAVEQQGRVEEAAVIYRRQLALARAQDDRRHEAWALVGLAYGATRDGRVEEAIANYEQATAYFRDLGDRPAAVWTLNGLGIALQKSGRFVEASAIYGQVADLARQVGYPAAEALAQNNRGALEFTLGDPGIAMNHFRGAARLQRETRQFQDAVVTGTNVALCLSHLGRLEEAAAMLDSLHQVCEQGSFSDRRAGVLEALAEVRLMQGRRHQAVMIYRSILTDDSSNLELSDRIASLCGLAQALAEMDSSAAALKLLQDEEKRRGGQMHGKMRIEFELALGERLRETGQVAAALTRFEFAIDATRAVGLQNDHVTALAGAARCQRELGKSAAAVELLFTAAQVWQENRAVPLDPEWREQRGVSGRLVYTQLAALILAGDDADGSRAERAFDAVQSFKARTLAERIGGTSSAAAWPAMTLRALQTEVLTDGEVFLDAYLGPAESILFAVTKRHCQAVVLADAQTLFGRLQRHYELLATPPTSARARSVVDAASERLGQDLLGPLAALFTASHRVVYSPDGVLNLVPLSTLNLDSGNLVCSRVPSATILGYLRSDGVRKRAPGHGLLAAAARETPGGEQLPGAVREVRHLAGRYRDVALSLPGGSGAALAPADLTPFNILHLATHARVDDQYPWASEIVLDARDPAGQLRAGRISELDLCAKLAVLSACETGSGRILSGEGVLGLSSAFLGAGVPAVVASLWPVSDRITAVLMERFYAELASGADPAQALAAAQRDVRTNPETAHPFHWAGFIVVGDGAAVVELEARPQMGRPAGVLLAAVVVGLVLLTWRRRSLRTGS